MKFKLSSMPAFAVPLTILFGLGYQLFTLQQQVRELRSEVQLLEHKEADFMGRYRANNPIEWKGDGYSSGVQSFPQSVGQPKRESVSDGSLPAPSLR